MRHRRTLLLALLVLTFAGCKKAEPVAPKAKPVVAQARKAAPAAPREHAEYTDMPTGTPGYTTTTSQAFAAEAQRGGPRGEARIFENPQEQSELARGASPKFMNGQFRYYLVAVTLVQPQGECKQPLLAVSLAVENLHSTPTTAIYGMFTFAQVVGGDGSSLSEVVAVPYHADILGPFSNKSGGYVYATAYLEPADARNDAERWAKIAAINPQRLKVWFKPEAFYYSDGKEFTEIGGKVPARRDVRTCAGTEGARSLLK